MESIMTKDMYGIDEHFAPAALGTLLWRQPGPLAQAIALCTFGAKNWKT